jgi:hypothetical protein
VALAVLATGLPPARAEAADVAADASPLSEWWADEPLRFTLNVYGWAPDVPIEIDAGPVSASLPLRLPTLLDDLQGGGMFDFEVRKGRFGAYASPIVIFLRDTERVQGPLIRRKIDIEDKAFLTDFGLSYEVGQWRLGGNSEAPTVTVEPFAGARWLIDDFDIDIDPGPDFSPDITFLTPVVGLRTFWNLTERWHVRAEGDYGGWNVDHVKRTWDAMGVVGYRFKMRGVTTHVFAGYRYLHVKYEKRVELRVSIRGPLAGIGFEF